MRRDRSLKVIVCIGLAIAVLTMTPGWTALYATGDGPAVSSGPHPHPLLSYKESSSGIDQPGMEGGPTEIEGASEGIEHPQAFVAELQPRGSISFVESSQGFKGLPWGGGPTELEFADWNGDGDLDILSLGAHGSTFRVIDGDGTGSWSKSMETGWGYGGVGVGDVNNDGTLDIVNGNHHNYTTDVTKCGSEILEVCLGPKLEKWSKGMPSVGEDYGMFGADVGDIDNDGWLDVGSTSFGCCNGAKIYRNNHDGTWKNVGVHTGGNSNNEFFFSDIDADGNLDLVASVEGGTVWKGDGKGGFARMDSGLPVGPIGFLEGLSTGDVNGDGLLELAFITLVGSQGTNELPYLFQLEGNSWKNISASIWPLFDTSNQTDLAWDFTQMGDLDNDGNTDIVVAGAPGFTVLLGDGTGKFTRPYTYSGKASFGWDAFRLGGDADHNGFADVMGVSANSYFFKNMGSGGPKIALISPHGGERFNPGSVRFIDWVASGTAKIKLEISTTGNGGPWTVVKDGLSNTGRYQWTVPNTPSKNCFIRVSTGTLTAMNGKPFEIIGASGPAPVTIQLNSPNGGENWSVGGQNDITWTISGGQPTFEVTLEYSVTGASGPWKPITVQNGVGSGAGKYTWIVPSDPSTNAFVKASVKDGASQTANDASNVAFTIYLPADLPIISNVKIDPSSPVTLNVGGKQLFSAKAYDTKGIDIKSATFSWTVIGTIGSLSSPTGASTTFAASASGPGEVKVTASYNSKSASNSTQVTVLPPGATIARVSVTPFSISGEIGKEFTLDAKAYDMNDTDITSKVTFAWSEVAGIVTISSATGTTVSVTLKSAGETVITVTGSYGGISKSEKAIVKVVKPQMEFPWWILYLLIAIVVAIVVIMLIAGRRKKKRSPYDWDASYGPQW